MAISDLNLYQVFYTVAKHQSFSNAAQALYISQPAISKSIKALELTLGTKLFSRTSRGVVLTPEGTALYGHIKEAFTSIDAGERLLYKLKNMDLGELRLGVSSTLGTHFLLPLLSSFTNEYPTLQVHVFNDSTLQTLDLLSNGQADLAIVSSPIPSDALEFIPLVPIQDILVCSQSYYQSIGKLSLKQLCTNAYFMLLPSSSVTRLHVENYFLEQGLEVIPKIEASNMDFLIACSLAGLGITSVIKAFVAPQLTQQTLVEIPLPSPIPTRSIGVAYSPKLSLSIAAQTFIHFLKHQGSSTYAP